MKNIPLGEVRANLPVGEMHEKMDEFLASVTALLPGNRLRGVVRQAVWESWGRRRQ